MAIDIHRDLGKVDGSWVDISTDRYKVKEEACSPWPPFLLAFRACL